VPNSHKRLKGVARLSKRQLKQSAMVALESPVLARSLRLFTFLLKTGNFISVLYNDIINNSNVEKPDFVKIPS